jgi:hypothetical protein
MPQLERVRDFRNIGHHLTTEWYWPAVSARHSLCEGWDTAASSVGMTNHHEAQLGPSRNESSFQFPDQIDACGLRISAHFLHVCKQSTTCSHNRLRPSSRRKDTKLAGNVSRQSEALHPAASMICRAIPALLPSPAFMDVEAVLLSIMCGSRRQGPARSAARRD